jgi:hypothetical protein
MRFLTALGVFFWSVSAFAAQVRLDIKVIYATNSSVGIDAKLKKLAREFSSLKFTSYELKDESTLVLDVGTAGRMQLPTKDWLMLRPREIVDDKLRLDLEIEKMKLKTTSTIARDGTLAIGGPAYKDGTLIIAITRDAKDVIKVDGPVNVSAPLLIPLTE